MPQPTMTVDKFGTKRWRLPDGTPHHTGGPAVEYANGTKEWYANGERHRVGGPAAEFCTGVNYWCQRGRLHRLDGPAIERPDGREEEWWVDGKRYPPPTSLTYEQACYQYMIESNKNETMLPKGSE
jgi:hypothetical protein